MNKGKVVRPCEICGKTIEENDEFVLVGKYPKAAVKWISTEYSGFPFRHYQAPESYGLIYHKSCFLESAKREGGDKQE